MTTVALVGAGGKMGCRITDKMKEQQAYRVLHVEIGEAGIANLARRAVSPVPAAEALPAADCVVLAVPDNRVATISASLVPAMKPGALLVCLDPAAPCAGRVHLRPDVACFVTHPCHPPVFNDETDLEAKRDFFGGVKAKQNIVCALLQGAEADYDRGVALCRALFAPVMNAYRLTVEQMAILEPALSETMAITFVSMMREGMEEAIRRGVPREAAFDFLLGHINIGMAIVFEQLPGAVFSDAAQKAIANARSRIFKPDWLNVFDKGEIAESIQRITR